MLLNGINHIALISKDIDALRAFYTEVFDADIRIVITVRPTSFVAVDGGLTPSELQALTEQLSAEH